MERETKRWETYEDVAAHLLNEMAAEFGLDFFEGKQNIAGKRSGTHYEIDAKGATKDGDVFVIVECRRYTTSKQSQERIAALAYRIIDTGATGGIIVSPLGLQEGAAKIASAENIHNVSLNPDSTKTDYLLRFLNKVRIGVSSTMHMRGSVSIKITHADGTVEERGPFE